MTPSPALRRSTPTRAQRAGVIAAFVAALLFAQSLGTLHRVAHAFGPSHGVPTAMAGASAHDGWLKLLFGGHDAGSAACDLVDQSTSGTALTSVAVIDLPTLVSARPRTVHRDWHLAAQSAGFLARGPPVRS